MENDALNFVRTGNLKSLKDLLDLDRIDIDAQDSSGRTLLHHAASNFQHEVLQCLLKNGADVLLATEKNNTVLHVAMTKNDGALVRIILENVTRDKLKKLLETKTKGSGSAALHVAAKQNSLESASLLLDYGANFEIMNAACEKPIDLVGKGELRKLLRLIDKSFKKAKTGDESLKKNLNECDDLDFLIVLNCRNKEGRTLIQELLLNGHMQLASDMILARTNKSSDDLCLLSDPNPKIKKEMEKLVERAREFRGFWSGQRQNIMQLTVPKCRPKEFKIMATHGGKTCCRALEKAHEVLLAYRKIEGKEKSKTTSAAMRCLEETIEVLGFDPERLYVIVGEEDSYYQKIPAKYKENIGWSINLLNCIIDAAIAYFLRATYDAQVFDAVIDNDITKVKTLIERGASINALTRENRSPLCYAAEKGNKEMVKVLLDFDAVILFTCSTFSPVYLAVKEGHAKIIEILLDKVSTEDLAETVDRRENRKRTVLHIASKKGRLDIVKILLKFGATYWIFDVDDCTPLDLSTNEEVSKFLKLIDECFHDAKEGDDEVIEKLKGIQTDEFLAAAGARNHEGQTLAVVAAKAKAKNIAATILKMISEAKKNEK